MISLRNISVRSVWRAGCGFCRANVRFYVFLEPVVTAWQAGSESLLTGRFSLSQPKKIEPVAKPVVGILFRSSLHFPWGFKVSSTEWLFVQPPVFFCFVFTTWMLSVFFPGWLTSTSCVCISPSELDSCHWRKGKWSPRKRQRSGFLLDLHRLLPRQMGKVGSNIATPEYHDVCCAFLRTAVLVSLERS